MVPIHNRPLRALSYLIEHRDRFVDKDELMEAVWPGSIVSEASLSTAIREVRQALGDDGQHQRWIKTARGHGFRFVGEVADAGTERVSEVAVPEDSTSVVRNRPGRSATASTAAGALIASAFAVLAFAALFQWQGGATVQPAPAGSIAVLAFADLSPHGDSEQLADGISEALINKLAQVPELRVTARTSSFAFKGGNLDIREIGRRLGVATLVEGSIRRTRGRLRVTAQLIDAGDGFQLWSNSWDQPFDEPFALHDEIFRSVVEGLQGTRGRGQGSVLFRRAEPPAARRSGE